MASSRGGLQARLPAPIPYRFAWRVDSRREHLSPTLPLAQARRRQEAQASVPDDRRAKRGGTVVARSKGSALERRLGVKFSDSALLKQALVHSSYVNENPHAAPGSNERLEFLGDAVLGLVVADELFAAYPDQDEGQLTELRTLLVRRDTLAKAARRLKLGDDLYLGKG